jgi:prolyl-tRNA editing enzyme YbaK/EbsC (Cys-tRNA(Pro) deacylase)
VSGSSVERVRTAAADLGLTGEIVELSESARTAVDAASALGCAVDQIAKSMIFEADGRIVLAVTSGANVVAVDKLAHLAGATDCRRARPDRVREVTGFAIGGVAPFGHLRPVRCWLDPHLLGYETIWVAAGSPRHVMQVPSDRLRRATGGTVADFVQ